MNPLVEALKRPLRPFARRLRAAQAARAYEARARALFVHLADYDPEPDLDSRVLIGSIRFHDFYFLLHLALGDIFARRGCTVSVLLDDFVLRHVDGHRRKDVSVEALIKQRQQSHAQAAALRQRCARLVEQLGAGSAVRLQFYSQLVSPRQALQAEELEPHLADLRRGILSRHVRASHNRFFGGHPFSIDDDEHRAYARLSIENEIIGRAVGRRLGETMRPDLFLCLDGLYSTFGPVAESMREHGARVLFHQPVSNYDYRASRRLIAVSEEPRVIDTSPAAWRVFESDGYSEALRRETEKLVAARLASPGTSAKEGTARLLSRLDARRSEFRRVVGLFPNLSWDGNVPDRDVLFSSFFDWLLETLDWGRDRGILFVLREHPQRAEAYFPSESVRGVLEHLRPGATRQRHVEFVAATEEVDSYALVREALDCSVVFNGTLGLEIPILGQPVVFAGHSPFAHRGVGYSPGTRSEYFELLETMTPAAHERSGQRERCRERAMKVAAFHFIYNLYPCPMMPSKPARVGLGFDYSEPWDFSHHPLRPDRNPDWQRTVDRILLDRVSAPLIAGRDDAGVSHACPAPPPPSSDTVSRA